MTYAQMTVHLLDNGLLIDGYNPALLRSEMVALVGGDAANA